MSTSLKTIDLPNTYRRYLQQRFFSWLDRRNPKQSQHKLTTRNLYIFPTKQGVVFLLFVSVLWLLGTNYQNNLILALTFLLISLFIVSILHTFSNLANMEVEYKGAAPVFAGDVASFIFEFHNKGRKSSDGIWVKWQESEIDANKVYVDAKSSSKVAVCLPAYRRGVFIPQRLMVKSTYPLGLFRCWTWLNVEAQVLVYPQPIEFPLANASVVDDDGEGDCPVKGGDDFSALHEYRPGDPIKHIAWKLYARERGLFTREFSQNLSREIWLDYSHVNASDMELKLSALCFWAIQLHLQDENFGLLLPHEKIHPNKGENHKARILAALARFNG